MGKINDIYKVITYDKIKYYLFCLIQKDRYLFIKDCGWGLVGNDYISRSNPIEFIANQNRAVNSKTSSGVDEIKRVYFNNLPSLVKKYLKEHSYI